MLTPSRITERKQRCRKDDNRQVRIVSNGRHALECVPRRRGSSWIYAIATDSTAFIIPLLLVCKHSSLLSLTWRSPLPSDLPLVHVVVFGLSLLSFSSFFLSHLLFHKLVMSHFVVLVAITPWLLMCHWCCRSRSAITPVLVIAVVVLVVASAITPVVVSCRRGTSGYQPCLVICHRLRRISLSVPAERTRGHPSLVLLSPAERSLGHPSLANTCVSLHVLSSFHSSFSVAIAPVW